MPKYKKVVRQGRAKVAMMIEARRAKRTGQNSQEETPTTSKDSQQNYVVSAYTDTIKTEEIEIGDDANIENITGTAPTHRLEFEYYSDVQENSEIEDLLYITSKISADDKTENTNENVNVPSDLGIKEKEVLDQNLYEPLNRQSKNTERKLQNQVESTPARRARQATRQKQNEKVKVTDDLQPTITPSTSSCERKIPEIVDIQPSSKDPQLAAPNTELSVSDVEVQPTVDDNKPTPSTPRRDKSIKSRSIQNKKRAEIEGLCPKCTKEVSHTAGGIQKNKKPAEIEGLCPQCTKEVSHTAEGIQEPAEIEGLCPKCTKEVSHTAGGIQKDQIKKVIAKVYHYFEQEYEEMKKIYVGIDLSPLSKFSQRTALATGVTETMVLQILKEEEEWNAAKRLEVQLKMRQDPSRKQRRARKRPRQEASKEDGSEDGEQEDVDDIADEMKVEPESPEPFYENIDENDEPEVYDQSVKVERDDDEASKELGDPIAVAFKAEPEDDDDDDDEYLGLTFTVDVPPPVPQPDNNWLNKDDSSSPQKIVKTHAQRQKEYRQRKKLAKELVSPKKVPKTNAEHQHKYRQKQKILQNQKTVELSDKLDLMLARKKKNAERAKRYRDKIKLKKQRPELDSLPSTVKESLPIVLVENKKETEHHQDTNWQELYFSQFQIQPSIKNEEQQGTSPSPQSSEAPYEDHDDCSMPNVLLHQCWDRQGEFSPASSSAQFQEELDENSQVEEGDVKEEEIDIKEEGLS